MLRLSKRTEYGLMAVRSIANCGEGEVLNSREIALRNGIPYELVARIMSQLVKNGIVVSQRGAHGGYALATSVEDVTLSRVMEALEGPFKLMECDESEHGAKGGECYLAHQCCVRAPLQRIKAKIRHIFDQTSISELM